MCQARRPPQQSPADRQADASADLERIAQALYEEIREGWEWVKVAPVGKKRWREHARRLLLSGVIAPGPRPKIERPLEGQTTIEEQLGG